MKTLNLQTWERKEHFKLFKNFKDPFFNVCANVDITNLKLEATKMDTSFFSAMYYALLKTVNNIESFKMRISDEQVIIHDEIGASCTILREDKTFGIGYLEYIQNFVKFKMHVTEIIEEVKNNRLLDLRGSKNDLLHTTMIPWISFSSFEHAKMLKQGDSIPKIAMGKIYKVDKKSLMPLSVSAHHAMMDGYHVGLFFEELQGFCEQPQLL